MAIAEYYNCFVNSLIVYGSLGTDCEGDLKVVLDALILNDIDNVDADDGDDVCGEVASASFLCSFPLVAQFRTNSTLDQSFVFSLFVRLSASYSRSKNRYYT